MSNIADMNKNILDGIADCVLLIDRDYKIVFANKAMLQLCGQKGEDVIGQKCHEFSHKFPTPCYKKSEPIICPHADVFKTGKSISVTHTHIMSDGTERIFEITASAVRDEKGDIIQMMEVLRDVTEKKKIDEALSLEHQQLLAIFDSIDEIVYVSDPDTYEILYANQVLKKIFGDVVGRICYLTFQNMESPCSFCTNDRIFGKNIGQSYVWEFQNRKNKRWYHCIDKAIRWSDGRMVRYEMAIDITERKQMEKMLKESEENYRNLVDGAPIGVYKTNLKGNIIYVNKALMRMFEFDSLEEAMSVNVVSRYKNPKDREVLIGELRKTGRVDSFEIEVLTKTGKTKNVILSATLEGNILSGMIMDITEKQRLEDDLKQRVKELEEFYNMAIGRELKMIELKGEIERLKEELRHYKT